MIRYFRFYFALSLLLVSLGTQAQPEPEDRKLAIRGQLLDAEFKEPMVQATIQLFTPVIPPLWVAPLPTSVETSMCLLPVVVHTV